MNLEQIKKDLAVMSQWEAVLFGSFAAGDSGPSSDIDVAVITRLKNRKRMFDVQIEISGMAPDNYDVHVFELLPLSVKGSIINQYIVLFGDPLEIGEYFYKVRKIWEDFVHRMEIPTIAEIRVGIEQRRKNEIGTGKK